MNRKKTATQFFLKKFFTKNELFLLLLSNLMISSESFADVTRNITTQINTTYSGPSDTFKNIVNIKSGGSINVTGTSDAYILSDYSLILNINTDPGKGIVADEGYALVNPDFSGTAPLEINLNSGLITSSKGNAILIQNCSASTKLAINTSVNTSISAGMVAIGSTSTTTVSILTINNAGNISGGTSAIKSTGLRSIDLVNSGTINGNISITTGKLTIANTAGSITGDIDLGSNSGSVITLSNGSITGDVLMGNNSQIINLNGGSYSGNINGSSASLGTVNVNSNQTLDSSSSIGSTNSINNLNINSGASLTLNSSSVSATNIALSGSLNLGDTATTITGNVAGSGSGLLNVGSAFHAVNGNLTLNSGDTLKVLVANDGDTSGKATVSGLTTVGSGAKLEVEFASSLNNYKYITGDKRYTIIDGASGSSINAIADSNINITKFSVFTLSTSTVDNDLFLNVSRKSVTEITDDESAQNAYTAINTIGDSATGSLKEIQQYIDSSDSAAEVESALKSIAPQADNGIILGAVTVVNNSVATIENRLDALRNGDQFATSSAPQSRANNYSSAAPIKTSELRKSSASKARVGFGSDEYKDIHAWSQTFGTTAKQQDLGSNDGYNSKALGFAFGYDKEIYENTRLGMSINYANSAITGKNRFKENRY